MSVGMFPDLEGLEMDMQYFSDLRPDYYCFSNETKEMTEAELIAQFASLMQPQVANSSSFFTAYAPSGEELSGQLLEDFVKARY